jgi:uncharacterized protein YjbI with pentapeptide repeats
VQQVTTTYRWLPEKRQQVVAAWNQWRQDNPDIRPDLSRADLHGAALSGVDLHSTDLALADLSAATLSKATRAGARLSRARLEGTNLTEANLFKAALARVDLARATLTGADLTGARLTGANVTEADLAGANFTATEIDGNSRNTLWRCRFKRGQRVRDSHPSRTFHHWHRYPLSLARQYSRHLPSRGWCAGGLHHLCQIAGRVPLRVLLLLY